ncbi:TPA: phage major capsid protein [Streptococcus pyogenes]|uniref:phage major capsid protein n=1 Tax=Streptococcus pyogenes TaxID=1314 RepID=UPI000DA2CE30|nr:phage major capsid protein [Streptococcus pyogenes]WSE59349.1 phage major capsid protein [Streptococcus pyogenes]WSE60463.1 phage major capsid protein [Streptococcus pyogenes]SQF44657.1 phage structural protein [Streptococcus pyogenes]HER0920707.1 phage major capsid protein [Streptococcus pyogenes]HER2948132.1 phage major capsid protein [Streptococcus pyogenes]
MTLKQGTLFPATLIPELISKVQGHSVLAKLSTQTPIPFNGTEQFIFNLDGNAQIVGEGEQKKAGEATLTSKVIKPLKFVYQARITNEFMYASDEKKINYLQAFADGFAKKIAEAFDIAAIHGLEPKALEDASFRATNSFDGVIDGNLVDYVAESIDDNIEAAVQAVRAKGGDVTGLALSPTAGGALGKLKDTNKSHIFPEFRFGQNPDSFYGMKSDINKTLLTSGGTAKKDHAIVGDFENMFKWGYAENIPMEVIEYGDPDGAGRDLKAYNEVCLRAEAFIGWGILDKDSFAIVKED